MRGNSIAISLLKKYKPTIAISIVSKIELSVGATDSDKKNAVKIIADTHEVLPLSKAIGEKALSLVEIYCTPNRRLYMPDALIAATCLEHNATLITFNTKDFKFIKGLKLAK